MDKPLTAKLNDAFKNSSGIDSSGGSNSSKSSEAGDMTVLFRSRGPAAVELVPDQARRLAAARGTAHIPCPRSLRPDASWLRHGSDRPGLVVELAYSQPQDECLRRAEFYLGSTSGEVRCVIIVDLRYSGLEASVLVVMGDWDDEGREPDAGGVIRHVWRAKVQVNN